MEKPVWENIKESQEQGSWEEMEAEKKRPAFAGRFVVSGIRFSQSG
jgi:hypothetical protein